MSLSPGFPDPVVTANIYCSGHLDHAFFRALKPFRDAFKASAPDVPFLLWTVRYGKCGEHVKVRIHSSPAYIDELRQLLELQVREFFGDLPTSSQTKELHGWSTAQAIDPEDRAEQPYPDRTLLWTTYKRSHVSLGPSPLIDDDRYVELCTSCLAAGADLLFSLESQFSGELSYKFRHSTLITALAEGMASLKLSPVDEANYLSYHRNSILRFCSLKNWWDREQAERVVKFFDQRINEKSLLDPVTTLVAQVATLVDEEPHLIWKSQIREFFLYVSTTKDCLDPFADRPEYPPLFKVLHGMSNQLGLRLVDEAFLYHLFLNYLCRLHSLRFSTSYSDCEPNRGLSSQLQGQEECKLL